MRENHAKREEEVRYARISIDEKRVQILFIEIRRNLEEKKPLELIIGSTTEEYRRVAESLGRIGRIKRIYNNIPYFCLECSPQDAELIAARVHRDAKESRLEGEFGPILDLVQNVDISSKVSIALKAPDDNRLLYKTSTLWNLEGMGVYEAWKYSTGDGSRIGIIDTGIDYTHFELSDNFSQERGYNFVEDNTNPMDDNGHGTHVAGICAGRSVGIATGSLLYGIKVLDENGSGSEMNVISGIDYAIDKQLDIINMSLGAPSASSAFEEICNKAYEKGTILVAAAGNDGYGANYPAAFGEPVISVGAVDRYNMHCDFSNIDPSVDCSAYGEDIVSTWPGGGFAGLSGTSMASPHAAAILSLGLAVFRNYNGSLEDALKETALHLESELPYENGSIFGAGLGRADSLVTRVMQDIMIKRRYLKKDAL